MNINIESLDEQSYHSDYYQEHLFEQYKLYLEMADRISSRRQGTNTFFLSRL
ncbi:RipA family octameric membrane protein [Enterovibrio norvegicus]|uniref:RipA family octameric membrane protein n=1 Tax=Enterovibrio norvegicus TaxID=188144 RepID=UPI0024B05569|nr:hypothetical protein [Enterovibrio norvegicus]